MNNKDLYKSVMSGIQPSENVIERIMDMTNNKKRSKADFIKGFVASSMAFVIAISAYGVYRSVTPKENSPFHIVALADDNTSVTKNYPLKEGEPVKTGRQYRQISEGVIECPVYEGFCVDGSVIKSVDFYAYRGYFEKTVTSSSDTNTYHMGYAELTLSPEYSMNMNHYGIVSNYEKIIPVVYDIEFGDWIEGDFTTVEDDIIVINAEYKNGKTEQKLIRASLSDDGYLMFELINENNLDTVFEEIEEKSQEITERIREYKNSQE